MTAAFRRSAAVAVLLLCASSKGRAQQSPREAARCDSVVAAARVDSERVAIFVSALRTDALMVPEQAYVIATAVATAFIPPSPFRLSVFSGPAQMRSLRRVNSDSTTELRVPNVTGVYRYTTTKTQAIAHTETLRSSLIPGFDSAAIAAIEAASMLKDVVEIPDGADSMRVEVRFSSTDSVATSRRMVAANFPRMRVVDAVPMRDNPTPAFPEAEKTDSTSKGEVVLRFVVDRTGTPAMETVEAVRATSINFLRAAWMALPAQRFKPAAINGCPVAQLVSYPFSFILPESSPSPSIPPL